MEKFSGPLSRRYGTALFDSLQELFSAQENFAQASEEIRLFAQVLDKKIIQIFNNQSFLFAQKQELLTQLLKAVFKDEKSELYKFLFNFLSLIIKNKRFAIIHSIFNFYFKLSDEYLNIVRANIVSARAMPQNMVHEFETAISKNIQKKVVFSNFIDKSLQCGFLVKIGSVDIDASLKSFLSKLQESIH